MRMNTAVGLSAVGVSLMLATAGCSRESSQTQPVSSESGGTASTAPASGQAAREQGQALVRVVNAVADAPPLDVIADEHTAFSGVTPKQVTPYKELPATVDDFAVRSSADASSQPLAKNTEPIMGGRHYTLIAFPDREKGNTVSLEVLSDDLEPPPAGKARVRVINAAAGTDDLSVYARGQEDALFGDVDFKEAVAYKEVDPIKTTIEIRHVTSGMSLDPKTGEPALPREGEASARTGTAADRPADRAAAQPDRPVAGERNGLGDRGTIVATQALDLEAGKTYTIIVTNRPDASSLQLDTLVVEDTVPRATPATED